MQHATAPTLNCWSQDGVDLGHPSDRFSFERTTKIVNNSAHQVGVATREGLKFEVQPTFSLRENNRKLLVRVAYNVDKPTYESVKRHLASSQDNSPELKIIRDSWSAQLIADHRFGARVVLDYPIDIEMIQKYGGAVYFTDLDMVISLGPPGNIPAHPYSRDGALYSHWKEISPALNGSSSGNFIYSIKIIDNQQRIGPRYAKLRDSVIKIEPTKDSKLADGFYVITNRAVSSGVETSALYSEYYATEEGIPFYQLCRTYQEAELIGTDREMEMARMKWEGAMSEASAKIKAAETAVAKSLAEKENLTRDAETKAQQHQHDMDRMREEVRKAQEERITVAYKDKVDIASTERKNTLELVKTVPAVILGILAAVMAFHKVFSP
jgi:hypothetical protein